MANLESINVNLNGGAPKYSVPSATILIEGVDGDTQRHSNHGGIDRAVLLYSSERIEELQQAKHPITPGSAGENLTIRGLDWESLREDDILQIGDVRLQLTFMAVPCSGIRESFFDLKPRSFKMERISFMEILKPTIFSNKSGSNLIIFGL